MWFSAIKLAINAGSHIYKKKQETKMRMADAQAAHAEKMAKGELEYSGKLLEARQSDWKDEFVLVVLTLPILVIAYGVFSERSEEHTSELQSQSTISYAVFCLKKKKII